MLDRVVRKVWDQNGLKEKNISKMNVGSTVINFDNMNVS